MDPAPGAGAARPRRLHRRRARRVGGVSRWRGARPRSAWTSWRCTAGRPAGRPAPSSSPCTASATPAIWTFDGAAEHWARRGIEVYAPDQRGFGGNADPQALAGRRCAGHGRDRHRGGRRAPPAWGLPLIVVGHSMGGGVALAAASRGVCVADALVLAGPAIAGGDALNPGAAGRRLGAGGRRAREALDRLAASSTSARPTTTRRSVRVIADPRHFADPSSRELYGLIEADGRRRRRRVRASPIPTLTLMGARDEVLRPALVRKVHVRIPGACRLSPTTPTAGTGSSATCRRRGSGATSPSSPSPSPRAARRRSPRADCMVQPAGE